MNEAGVLGRFVPDFGKIVAMMQFNMYHHYTVDEHLIRAIGVLAEIDRGGLADAHPLANEIMPAHPGPRGALRRAVPARHRQGPAGGSLDRRRQASRASSARGSASTARAPRPSPGWSSSTSLMSMTAQSRDLTDRKTIVDFAAVVQSLERLKMLLVLTVADIRAVGPGVWNGWKGQLLRTLYYETEPVLTGGHSQVSRDRRVAEAKAELAAALARLAGGGARPPTSTATTLPTGCASTSPTRSPTPKLIREADAAKRTLATAVDVARLRGRHRDHGVRARPSAAAVDHRRRLHGRRRPTSSTRRSSPPPTARRSTRSRSAASSTTRRTSSAGPSA